ncbi:MAG: CBS domain-containing protein [Chthoniobacterales bacterium]
MEKKNTEGDTTKKLGDVVIEKAGILTPDHTTEEAAHKMRAMETDVLPVTEDRRLVGMMSGQYADREVAKRGHDPKMIRVGEQMSRDVIFCYEHQDRTEADRIMKEKNLRYLPVVDNEMRIVGMITRDDIVTE